MRFDRKHVHAYADVIVAAAPNAKRARQEYRVSDDALLDALRDRIRFVLAICDELGREKLVLGAWGCENNGFDAEAVAELFRKELASGDFKVKQVFFAVPSTRWDQDFAKFEHVLDKPSPSATRSPMLRLPPAPQPPVPPSRPRLLPRTTRMTMTGASTCNR